MKQKILALVLGLIMLTSGSGLIYARATESVNNTFEFGVVDISLDEYQIQNNKEVPAPSKTINIVPGMIISKIPRIHNSGADCYVRAKISFKNTDQLDEYDVSINKHWKRADDGYWYYTKVLPAEDDVDLYSSVNIPNDFPESESTEKIKMTVQIDAIQAKNFEPNFKRAKPWGNVEIIAYKGDEEYAYSQFRQSNDRLFTITYQGEADELIANRKDFFENMPFLMPGDSYDDKLTIQNNSRNPMKLYFGTKYDPSELELLEKIDLTITKTVDGMTSTVYDGNLAAASLQNSTLIDTFDAGEQGTMSFEISVPKELNNEYALQDSAVTWIFSSEKILPENPDGNNTPDRNPEDNGSGNSGNNSSNNNNSGNSGNNSGNNGNSGTQNPGKGPNNPSAPQTSDIGHQNTLLAIFIAATIGLCMTYLFPLWKKKKEAGEHEV